MAFTFELPVRYGSVDFAQIVYYPQFLHFCHVTKEAMFPEVVGISYADLITKEKVGYPTVKSNAEFKRPVGYGETLTMTMYVERLGTSSVDFRYEGHRSSDGALAFVVHNTEVAVSMEAWGSVPMPDHHRKAFETLMDGAGATPR